MDSNRIQKTVVLLVFGLFCLSSYGQNIQKYYVFKAQEKGNLYHLLPVSLFEDAEGEELSYDLTYTSWNDSMAMNFTYTKKEPLMVDSIRYVSGKIEIAGKADKLYVEPTSKKWVHRYSLKSKADEFFQLYDAEVTPQIFLYTKDMRYEFQAKKTNWRKYVPVGQKLFKMIKLQEK